MNTEYLNLLKSPLRRGPRQKGKKMEGINQFGI
jgi:hypothetical protein